jgi:hypothetical protein
MPAADPAHANRAAIVSTTTRQGYSLPVIDVSHPAFALQEDSESVEALRRTFAEAERQRKRIPKFILGWLPGWMARRSLLARELFAGPTEVLSGLSTYVIKLGAANLVAPFNTPLDRRLAAAPGSLSLRIRLQQLAGMLAEGLRPRLLARPGTPLHLVNIGGGTAIDSLNTFILLRNAAPETLRRSITLHILDPDTEGPEFGERALAALRHHGPLTGLEIRFKHVPYDWNDASSLAGLVRELSASGAMVAVSSEGALFEYGDDDTVLSNLTALRGGSGVMLVGGTVTRADDLLREFLTTTRFKLVPRGAQGLNTLAKRAGFLVSQVKSAILSDQVLLLPA